MGGFARGTGEGAIPHRENMNQCSEGPDTSKAARLSRSWWSIFSTQLSFVREFEV